MGWRVSMAQWLNVKSIFSDLSPPAWIITFSIQMRWVFFTNWAKNNVCLLLCVFRFSAWPIVIRISLLPVLITLSNESTRCHRWKILCRYRGAVWTEDKFCNTVALIDLFKEVWDGALLFWKMADTRESSPRCWTGVAVGKVVNKIWNLTLVIWFMKEQGGFSMKTNTCLSHERNV